MRVGADPVAGVLKERGQKETQKHVKTESEIAVMLL